MTARLHCYDRIRAFKRGHVIHFHNVVAFVLNWDTTWFRSNQHVTFMNIDTHMTRLCYLAQKSLYPNARYQAITVMAERGHKESKCAMSSHKFKRRSLEFTAPRRSPILPDRVSVFFMFDTKPLRKNNMFTFSEFCPLLLLSTPLPAWAFYNFRRRFETMLTIAHR